MGMALSVLADNGSGEDTRDIMVAGTRPSPDGALEKTG